MVHELYHIDPACAGIRQLASDDGGQSSQCHGPSFYLDVAEFVKAYLRTQPDPAIYEFLRYDFAGLTARYGQVVATTFRNFPSYPQIYLDPLAEQPRGPETPEIVPPAQAPRSRDSTPQQDVVVREFRQSGTRRLRRAGASPGGVSYSRPASLPGTGPPSRAPSNGSTRTTPREFGAWMNRSGPSAMPTWVGPRAVGAEEHQVAGLGLAHPRPHLGLAPDRPRQRQTPFWAKTNWTKPLQSKPVGGRAAVAVGRPEQVGGGPEDALDQAGWPGWPPPTGPCRRAWETAGGRRTDRRTRRSRSPGQPPTRGLTPLDRVCYSG